MSFEYKPVFLEEYNQTLRDSVNTYYTHACLLYTSPSPRD